VILTTPLLGVVCHRRLGFDKVYQQAKFEHFIASTVPEIWLVPAKI